LRAGGANSMRRQLDLILDAAGEGIYGVDAHGTTTFMNPAALKALGLTAEEAVGRKLHDVIHHSRPDGSRYPAPECPIYQAAHGGPQANVSGEVFFRKDGTPFPVDYVTAPVHDGDRIVGAVTVFRDITEQQQAQQRLQASLAEASRVRRHLELILDAAGEGIYGVDAEGTTTFMNPAALKALGLTAEEAVGRKLHDVIHHSRPDGSRYPAPECPIYQAAHGGPQANVSGEVFFRKDGTPFPVDYVTAPVHDGDRIVGAVTVFRDVTDRRRTEEALQAARAEAERQRERLRRVLREAPVPIAILRGPSYRFELANEMYARLVGRPVSQIEGRSALDVFPEIQWAALRPMLDQALGGVPYKASEMPVAFDGDGDGKPEPHILALHLEPLARRDGEEAGIMAVAVEVTDQVRARQAVEAYNERLEQLGREKAQFLNLVAHELRTPITPLMMQVQGLRAAPQDERQRRTFDLLDRNLRRLNRLVQELLELARMDAGKLTLLRERVELDALVAEAVDTYRESAQRQGVELVVEGTAGAAVDGDAERLVQVAVNLLSNALKATPAGGKVVLRTHAGPDSASLEVSDTGQGFGPEQGPKLFEPFAAIGYVGKESTGLGLYISKGIVEQHGGTLEAHSDGPGKGARFTLTLPRCA